MNATHALAVAALVASVLLLLAHQARVPAIAAVVASGIEVLLGLGIVRLSVTGLPLGILLGAALVVAGVVAYLRVGAKAAVTAATVVVLVGAAQVLRGLRVL